MAEAATNLEPYPYTLRRDRDGDGKAKEGAARFLCRALKGRERLRLRKLILKDTAIEFDLGKDAKGETAVRPVSDEAAGEDDAATEKLLAENRVRIRHPSSDLVELAYEAALLGLVGWERLSVPDEKGEPQALPFPGFGEPAMDALPDAIREEVGMEIWRRSQLGGAAVKA